MPIIRMLLRLGLVAAILAAFLGIAPTQPDVPPGQLKKTPTPTMAPPTATPEGGMAIVYVQAGGNSTKAAGGTSLVNSFQNATIGGNLIVLFFAMDGASGTVSAADLQGNTYVAAVDTTTASGNVRTVILYVGNATSLPTGPGGTITITHPSATARTVVAMEFSGVASTSLLDQTTSGVGNSVSPSSGNITTTVANEVLVGAVGVEAPDTDGWTAGTNWTTPSNMGTVGTSGGGAASNISIRPEYRIVSTTVTATADGTIPSARWAAAIASFKAASALALPPQAQVRIPMAILVQ